MTLKVTFYSTPKSIEKIVILKLDKQQYHMMSLN